jgi:hypothetical protein
MSLPGAFEEDTGRMPVLLKRAPVSTECIEISVVTAEVDHIAVNGGR